MRGVTAILDALGLPYNNYHSSIILAILYMAALYFAIRIIKPMLKLGIVVLIIWAIIGFFKI